LSDDVFLPPHTKWLARLAGVIMVLLLALGACYMVSSVFSLPRQALPRTMADFMEGRTTAAIEKAMAEGFPLRGGAIAAANGLRYRLLADAPEAVRVGHDGILFLTEEMIWHREAEQHQETRVQLLAQVSRILQQQGVTLVVALVPDKSRILQHHVRGGYPRQIAPRYDSAVAALRAAGVSVVALDAALKPGAGAGSTYYSSDTHWNQNGARAAAADIARHVLRLVPVTSESKFHTEAVGPSAPRTGDLVTMMGLAGAPSWLRPPVDEEAPLRTIEKKPASAEASLFGNAAVPVVLVGTSYSLRANFHGFLQESLGVPVLNAARDGAGFLQAAGEYFRNEAFTSDKPQVVIWELPERFLQTPLGQEGGFIACTGLGAIAQASGAQSMSGGCQ
jgi:alginate O-acetyltransferase complex protein AlgJ